MYNSMTDNESKKGQVDNTAPDPELTLDEKKISLLSFGGALNQEAKFSLSFALSRFVLAAQSIGYIVFIRYCSIPYAASASTIMFMIQQGVYGSLRGWLSSTAVISGTLNGENKFSKIGPAVNQGLLMALITGLVFGIPMFFSGDILSLLIDKDVANQAGSFLRAAAVGLIPSNLAFVDQLFLLSVKQLCSAISYSAIQVGLSLFIGMIWSNSSNSLDGLGYGMAIGSLSVFLLDRLIMACRKEAYKKYDLFCSGFDSGTTFGQFSCLSFPTLLQALSEWLPTVLITALLGGLSFSKQALDAIEPAMMSLIVVNTILLGLGTAATVSTSNHLGSVKSLQSDQEKQKIMIANTKTVGYANVLLTLLFTMIPAAFCLAFPRYIGDMFLGNSSITSNPMVNASESTGLNNYTQQWFADTSTRFTGATFLADGIRNTLTGIILGRKNSGDNYISAISNLLMVTGLSTLIAYYAGNDIGPISYFATRMVSVLIMAIGMYAWWCKSKDVKSGSVSTVTTLAAMPNQLSTSSSDNLASAT